jgi:hypothetical protein
MIAVEYFVFMIFINICSCWTDVIFGGDTKLKDTTFAKLALAAVLGGEDAALSVVLLGALTDTTVAPCSAGDPAPAEV